MCISRYELLHFHSPRHERNMEHFVSLSLKQLADLLLRAAIIITGVIITFPAARCNGTLRMNRNN